MKNWNIFYWIVAPFLLIVLYELSERFHLSHKEYFGEAEARQSEINLNQDVLVTDIYTATGQKVKKGDTLLRVINQEMDENILQLDLRQKGADAEMILEKSGAQAKIFELEQKKQLILAELQTKYNTIKAETDFFYQLAGNSIPKTESYHYNQTYLNSITEEMEKTRKEYDRQINHYTKMSGQTSQRLWEKEQIKRQQQFLKQNQKSFEVVAPYDGIVGHINVRQGEFVKSFASLITFMEPSPTEVKGYVPEKYTVNIKVGDTVAVSSLYHRDKEGFGIISAIGNRIIEIPEKFNKIPNMKLYGIEVFIRIPQPNYYFQKEIVSIKPWMEK
jgi:multidrug resistance efflux pump